MSNLSKNRSIGVKIGFGFGIVLAAMLTMGILAAVKMGDIRKNATRMSREYLPELTIGDKLEKNMLTTQYLIRSYDESGKKDDADNARKYLGETKNNIAEAKALSEKFRGLAKLTENIGQIAEKFEEYQQLVEKTIEKHSAILNARKPFDEAAASYMQNAHEMMDSQFASMKNDINSGAGSAALTERLKKIELLHEILSTGYAIRIANFKFQAFHDPDIARERLKDFDKIAKSSEELRPLLKKQETLTDLVEITEAANEYKKRMEDVLRTWTELREVTESRVKAAANFRTMTREVSNIGTERVLKVANGAVATLSEISRNMAIVMIIAMIFGIFVAVFITSGIKKSVSEIAAFTRKFGSGDLSSEVDIRSNDEIGQMANDLNASVRNLRNLMRELADTTNMLSSSSEELSAVSEEMASGAEEMNSQAMTVAGASEQMSANIAVVAAAAGESGTTLYNIASMTEEMSSAFVHVTESGRKTAENVRSMAHSGENISAQIGSIATATEEMTVSLNEVAKNIVKASQISQNANNRTEEINAKMSVLSASSKRIGKVVEMIKDIADQTNMLALNATIEAAGAGDAGRGFAVVAGEVKELAKQSAAATDEIAEQVEEIRKSVTEAVSAIEDVGKVITQIADINQMIASSAEEQTATAGEISKSVANTSVSAKIVARNAAESSQLVEDIARAIEESSKTAKEVARSIEELLRSVQNVAKSAQETSNGSTEISKNIQGISMASKTTAVGASQTSESAMELARMAAKLTEMVNRFGL